MTRLPLSVWQHEYEIDAARSDNVSFDVEIPVIADEQDWAGWAWIRSSPTWIEVEPVDLVYLIPNKQCYLLLLRSKSDSSHQIAIYPVSSTTAHGTLRAGPQEHQVGLGTLQLRGNLVTISSKVGKLLVIAVSSKAGSEPEPWRLVERCVEIGRQWLHQLQGRTYQPANHADTEGSPLNRLSFCTWTSLGETTRPTLQNLTSLCQSIRSSCMPIQSFLIDAGWQSINSEPNTGNIGGDTIRRKLMAFEPYDGLGASLQEVVGMIKRELPTVRDVGVWMTLQGFWCAIDASSPLVSKYACKAYPISRTGLPGISNEPGTISYIDPSDSHPVWHLPPPDRAHDFWSDWFVYLKSQGVSWIKVDNQASMSVLAGVEGAECATAMWKGMCEAADETFGPGRVLHCMSHSERVFNGDIGLGLATLGRRIVVRNTDDYGRLWLAQPHQDHVFQNLYTSILTSNLCVVPDGDMFMSQTEAPVFHAVLRALMPGPILLTDKQGQHDHQLVHRFVGETKAGRQMILKTDRPAKPVQNRLFDGDCRAGGHGRALLGSVRLPELDSVIVGCWNVREDHVDNKVDDWITADDLIDTLSPSNLVGKYLVYKPGYCSESTWAQWTPTQGDPKGRIMHLTLNHLAAETILVVPIRELQIDGHDVRVALCGLVDKFAGLVGISDVRVGSRDSRTTGLSCRVECTGTFGLAIQQNRDLPPIKVFIDDRPANTTEHNITMSGGAETWTWITFPIVRDEHSFGTPANSSEDGSDAGWLVTLEW